MRSATRKAQAYGLRRKHVSLWAPAVGWLRARPAPDAGGEGVARGGARVCSRNGNMLRFRA